MGVLTHTNFDTSRFMRFILESRFSENIESSSRDSRCRHERGNSFFEATAQYRQKISSLQKQLFFSHPQNTCFFASPIFCPKNNIFWSFEDFRKSQKPNSVFSFFRSRLALKIRFFSDPHFLLFQTPHPRINDGAGQTKPTSRWDFAPIIDPGVGGFRKKPSFYCEP